MCVYSFEVFLLQSASSPKLHGQVNYGLFV